MAHLALLLTINESIKGDARERNHFPLISLRITHCTEGQMSIGDPASGMHFDPWTGQRADPDLCSEEKVVERGGDQVTSCSSHLKSEGTCFFGSLSVDGLCS